MQSTPTTIKRSKNVIEVPLDVPLASIDGFGVALDAMPVATCVAETTSSPMVTGRAKYDTSGHDYLSIAGKGGGRDTAMWGPFRGHRDVDAVFTRDGYPSMVVSVARGPEGMLRKSVGHAARELGIPPSSVTARHVLEHTSYASAIGLMGRNASARVVHTAKDAGTSVHTTSAYSGYPTGAGMLSSKCKEFQMRIDPPALSSRSDQYFGNHLAATNGGMSATFYKDALLPTKNHSGMAYYPHVPSANSAMGKTSGSIAHVVQNPGMVAMDAHRASSVEAVGNNLPTIAYKCTEV